MKYGFHDWPTFPFRFWLDSHIISNYNWAPSPFFKWIPKILRISIPRFRVKYTMWSRKSYTVCDSNMIETHLMGRIQSCLAGRRIVISSCFTSSLCICHLKNVFKLLRTIYIQDIDNCCCDWSRRYPLLCQRYFQILLLTVDKYISPSEKESLMLDNIVESIKSGESCTLRLIHSGDVMCFCVFFIDE